MKSPEEIKEKGKVYYNNNRTVDLEFTAETTLFSVNIETQGNDLFVQLNIPIKINAANANIYVCVDDVEYLLGTTPNTNDTVISSFTRIINEIKEGKHTISIKSRPSQSGRIVTWMKYVTTSLSVIEL